MPGVTIDNIPLEIFHRILEFTNNSWDLINAQYVSKSWNQKLKTTFDKFKEVYQSLIEKSAEAIVEEGVKSPQVTQVICMAHELLKKLTLDQVVVIATSSYVHAEIVFKSRLFHDKPGKKIFETNSGDSLEDLKNFINAVSNLDLTPDIFQQLMASTWFSDMSKSINKLNRPELVEEENDVLDREFREEVESGVMCSSKITAEIICRAYIARAVAEQNTQNLRLVIFHARETLGKPRLLALSKASLDHTKIILNSNLLKKKLTLSFLREMAGLTDDHKKMVYLYAINTLCSMPIKLVIHNPSLVKNVATLLIKDIFYDASYNAGWKNLQLKKPDFARHILELNKIINKKAFLEFLFKKMMDISISHAKELLSIPRISQWVSSQALQELSKKDSEHHALVSSFLPREEIAPQGVDNAKVSCNRYKP